jgi:S-adenosylmethionine:tRNA ribosyltransferase-isomerase
MHISLFDFSLPDENIALRPAEPRDSARMLVVKGGECRDASVLDLPSFLKPGDALVFNNTKVIPARLSGIRKREGVEAKIEILLHKRKDAQKWQVLAKPAKKLKVQDVITFNGLEAVVESKSENGFVTLSFVISGPDLDAAIMRLGDMPLPPYIASRRPADTRDQSDYQTVYAQHDGAVAAPTAGLHFTERLFKKLDERGISRHFITLHVGAGTFLPVKVEDTRDHVMHLETGHVDAETAFALNMVRQKGGRIVAVGTTSLRLLESASDDQGKLHAFSGDTGIFITPGYHFKAVDALMTNFHLPKSTLFMLVSAFCGLETMRDAYDHAIRQGYRFYSYGDSSLLFPHKV